MSACTFVYYYHEEHTNFRTPNGMRFNIANLLPRCRMKCVRRTQRIIIIRIPQK